MRNLYTFLLATLLLIFAGSLSAQTITITSPNGGESWNGCTSRNITWSMSGIGSPYFDIDYSPDNGSNWVAVASNYFSPGGTYSWTLPNITSSSFLVRVKLSSNGAIVDVSDALFTVTGPLILTSPNGAQSWVAGTVQTITWTPNGTSNNYKLEYTTNNGASWLTIINPLATTGNTYNWTIPNTPSNTCLVRISDNGDPTCKVDVSDNVFYILSSITVTQPNGGQIWAATVGSQGVSVNMDNVTVTANTGNFYDGGGAGANYSYSGSTFTKTFLPDVGTNKLRFYFNSFATYNSNDYLRVYNGPSTASPILGTYSGSSLPPTLTSTHATGALTFLWVTGSGYTAAGWDAYFVSVGTPTQSLNWSITGTSGKFNLDYSTNSGSSWVRIVSGLPSSTGVFPWNVPNTPSTNCLVKVSDAGNGAIVDQSDAVFTIGPANPMLLTPNGGEVWYAGTVQNITWVPAFFTGANVKLEWSTDNGSTWSTVVSSTPNAAGTFAWTLPNTPSTTALVRVSDALNALSNDVSNAVFTIMPHVTVTSPNGGQNWTGCSTQNITWSHGGTSGLFNLEYSTDNGTTWTGIVNNYNGGAGPSSSYSWQVPNTGTLQGLVRVTDAGDPLKADQSNTVFTITQTTNIVLLTPNGSENWVTGTTQAITYTVGGGVTTVRLEYSTNNGTSWTTIIGSTSGGVYNWLIPNTPSGTCLVRATDTGNACNTDLSNSTFTIVSQITVIDPNGGEIWQATVGQQGISYNMDNVPVTMNTGNFYDGGGIAGNYVYSGSALVKTFTPDVPTNKLRVSFTSFSTYNGSDILRVYNGPNTGSPLLGTYSASTLPPTLTSTHTSGALTFQFTTGSGYAGVGWQAYIQSVGTATQNVDWSIIGTSQTFNLEYSTNAGTSWTRILTNYPSSTGVFPWQVPNSPTTQARFKVIDYQNNAVVDQSDANFTIGQASAMLVTPNGGENWYAGTSQNITWVSMFIPGLNVKLEYSTNNGSSWTTIVGSYPNTGSYAWTIPNTPTTTALVRVSDAITTTINDQSNSVFTIHPYVTVTSPNGGQNWTGCSTQNITWNHGGTSGLFDLDYSTDNGTTWIPIMTNYNGGAGPASSYSWQVPNVGTNNAIVRVTDAADILKTDVSNATFIVTQTNYVTVVAPNGGEVWIAGTNHAISYSTSGPVVNVRLEYSTNNGTTWTTIVSSTTGGTYNWTVPNVNTSQALIRATDAANSCIFDVSNGTFNLLSQVAVLTPNGGEVWQATVGSQGLTYVMDNINVTLNTGNFYDQGGPSGNYNYSGAALVKTFTPDIPSNKLRVTFNSFSTYNGSDILRVYNGPTTGSPLLGTYSASSLPPVLNSTHTTGALTFQFTTGSGYSGAGWDAFIQSVGTPTQNVTWSIIGTSNTYNLDYSTNNGSAWTRILTNYPSSTGVFPWSVPNTPSTNCLFKVTDNQNNAIVDQSNATFTIGVASPILVTPNGGENWFAGSSQTISWVSMFMPNPTVKLEYSVDGGTTWLSIIASAPNTGTYNWTVPNNPSSTVKVRISDTVSPLVNDVSNNNFTISTYVTVTAPNGGQNWLGCSTQSISWNHGGTTGLFDLEYSTNSGSTWTTIVSSYNGGAGPGASYSWMVPNVGTAQAMVRVTDASDPLKTDLSNAVFTITQTSNVQLLTPNGGEVWVAGTSQNINYSVSGGVTNVRLEYSTNNGTSWTTIIGSTSGGTYVWTVPNVNSTTALVRVSDAGNSCNSDVSDANFNLVSTITVNQPNGGEVWQATVGTQGIAYNMDNTPVTLNTGNFYDAGGISGNYVYSGSPLTKTFTPDIPTNKLRVTFTSFSTYNGSDILRVYNGPNTGSPLLGTFSASSLPPTLTSTHATGTLTFQFTTGSGYTGSGWAAYITSVGTPTQTVNWGIIGTSNTFNLEYTTNNGTNWTRILTNYPSSTGNFLWSVPNTPSTNCKFKVIDYQNNAIVDQSDATFTIGAASPLLVAPNGGENWYAGTSQSITWVSMFMPNPTVKLEYSIDGGTTWLTIVGSTPNTGSYSWFVPNNPSTTVKVRISDTVSPLVNDVSNANFTISPYVTVTSPNGGQNWLVCSVQSISWNHGGTTGLFNLAYSTDNGATWTPIVNNYNGGAGPAASYSWTIPNISSSTVLVSVTDAGDPLKTDQSNATFTITPTNNVVLVSPNGGESWVAGTTQPITYSLGGGVTAVRLEYSTDNGTTWTTIIGSTTGGVYNWTIPNVNSNQVLVKATDTSNPCNNDQSNGTLNLISTIAVTSPNGGEIWQATVGNQGLTYNMDNTPITLNTGNFYDQGGISGNYSYSGAALTKTFTPDIPTNKLRVTFTSFSTYNGSDILRIYNGPTTGSPLLGTYSSTSLPPVLTSTHSTGTLTFQFTTGSGYTGAGWNAYIQSVGTPTQSVNWTITGTSQTFNLEYTTNNGSSWTRILTNYPSSTGIFPWSVPNTPSTNCKFKVIDYGNNAIVDQSDAVFTIGQASQFVVTPNGGETWYAGTSQNITWVSMFNPSPNVKLEYSTNSGTTWSVITNSTPNTGSYGWTIPNTPSLTCLVRVSDAANNTFNDVSNAVFRISPHVTVTAPNGGNTFQGCNTTNITWLHGGTSGLFDLDYTTNNGGTWTNIVNNYNGGAGPNGSYSWQVPNVGSAQYLVRVRDDADTLVKTDVSDAVFTVNQTTNVVVVAPNGNENWIAGTTQSIMYSVSGGVTSVRLEYSTNGGTSWTTIVSSTTGGSYSWLIPNVYSTNTLVRATDVSVACNSDVSNSAFTLTSSVNVTVPNGGEVFPATVGPQGSNWVMNNITETMNTGNFYDAGGPSGSYSYSGSTIVKTFYPDVPVNKLRIAFNSFSTYNASDYLRVYNGPNTSAPVLGTYSASTLPPTLTSTHSTGALTFAFTTGSGYTAAGWDAMMTSIGGTPTQAVTWNIIGTSQTYNMEYSTNNGTSWIRILTNYPSSTGSFAWQVPNTVSTNCLYKVMDYANNAIVDQSNSVFTIGEPTPLLAVPNGGETWYSGQSQNIVWSAPSFLNTLVKLEWSSDNGATWNLINANAPNNGTYAWTVPNTLVPLPVCLVRVSDYTFSYKYDISNAVFQIRPPIMIVSPNGPSGSTWRACTSSSITWTAGASANYKIELSTNAGSTWTIVNAAYASGASNVNYSWSIPNTPSTQCLVKVTDNANPLFTDVSDSLFTISPSIQVTYPNFGATIQSGSVTNITWINYNASNFYNIDYSTDGGLTWLNIVTNHNTGSSSYAWNVPVINSTNCLVRVTDFTSSCKSDVSDFAFTVQPAVPPVNITSPNGGESWAGCSVHDITWTTNGTSNLFNLEYSTNGGTSWNTIATNFNTTTNIYSWTVPNIATAQALVRVTDATASTKTDVSNQVFIITQPVTAVINPTGTVNICAGATVTLTSNSATGNVWSTGATTQTISVGSSGTYTVTVTNTGCSATSLATTVVVNALPATPTITAGGSTTFCAGGSVTLTSSAASGNSWLPGGQTTQQILVTTSGTYSVQVTNAAGCSSTSNPTTVTVNALPYCADCKQQQPCDSGWYHQLDGINRKRRHLSMDGTEWLYLHGTKSDDFRGYFDHGRHLHRDCNGQRLYEHGLDHLGQRDQRQRYQPIERYDLASERHQQHPHHDGCVDWTYQCLHGDGYQWSVQLRRSDDWWQLHAHTFQSQ